MVPLVNQLPRCHVALIQLLTLHHLLTGRQVGAVDATYVEDITKSNLSGSPVPWIEGGSGLNMHGNTVQAANRP